MLGCFLLGGAGVSFTGGVMPTFFIDVKEGELEIGILSWRDVQRCRENYVDLLMQRELRVCY